jgi:hypothetical protein
MCASATPSSATATRLASAKRVSSPKRGRWIAGSLFIDRSPRLDIGPGDELLEHFGCSRAPDSPMNTA